MVTKTVRDILRADKPIFALYLCTKSLLDSVLSFCTKHIWCGLEPYFIDISIDDWYMDKTVLLHKIEELKEEVAIVVPYATFGSWMNLEEYEELEKKGIPVVVDAAPGFGLMNGGMHYGQDFSGMIVYSFHATKPFGIGEGGLIYSKTKKIYNVLKEWGISDLIEIVNAR